MKLNYIKGLCAAVAILASLGLTSCGGFLEEYSQDLAKVQGWQDLDEVLLGEGYIHPGHIDADGGYWESGIGNESRDLNFDFLHYMTDEMYLRNYSGGDVFRNFETYYAYYTWQPDLGVDHQNRYMGGDEKYWNGLYSRIQTCNMVISLIGDQPETLESDKIAKKRILGEALFLRGLYYFMLTNIYCEPYAPSTAASTTGMPLKFTEFIEDKEFERANLRETYEKIVEDLLQAAQSLEGTTPKSVYHADVNTVNLLLSRVYLYMQNWDKAAEYANKAIASGKSLMSLSSVTPGQSCLSATNPELFFTMGDYLVSAMFLDRKRYEATWEISSDMTSLYEQNDLRAGRYFGQSEFKSSNAAFLKYSLQYSLLETTNQVGSVFTFRLAEAYLNLAEAELCAGNEAEARKALDTLRNKRIAGNTPSTESGEALAQVIRDERAREFLLEGHRWFDLRRYSVNEKYPWSKEIIHGYRFYITDFYSDFFDYELSTSWYRLEKNDPAYTLPIPRKVRNFQVSLGTSNRPNRSPYLITTPDYDEGDDDWGDDDWGDDDWGDDW